MNKLLYNNYIKTISSKYKSLIGDIKANYNFDLGIEFEIVVCEILQDLLPSNFGVCRGFLVSANGDFAGDDIIIFDRTRFPQLRLLGKNDLAHKQEIPIEAAYAYIEAKNSLVQSEKNSFEKALLQVSKVKELVSTRESVTVKNAFNPYIGIDIASKGGRKNWPNYLNPFFSAVMAPNVKAESGTPITEPNEIIKYLVGDYDTKYSADLIVAGMDVCYLPFIKKDDHATYHSPFNIEDKSVLMPYSTDGDAFSVGMCSLLYALDAICLGIMPWPNIIANAVGIDTTGNS